MTTTDLAVRTDGQQLQVLTNDQLSYIAMTEFVPPGLRGNLPAILACVATGRALGIADMTALRSIHIIDGKATFSAELMVMLARQRGHSIQGEVSEGSATVTGKRADNGDTMVVTWTLAMADRAGLVNKQNWKKYPEAMLWARAVSQLCRELFADCFAGATYTPEELGEADTGPSGAPEPAPDPAEDVPFGDVAPPLAQEVVAEKAAPKEPPVKAKPSAAMLKKANTLIGKLRTLGRDPTGYLYARFERARDQAGPTEDGLAHWGPLRDAMTFDEMREAIDVMDSSLAKLEQKAKA
jgi:hypothetical protein